jgi:hypothetical protein
MPVDNDLLQLYHPIVDNLCTMNMSACLCQHLKVMQDCKLEVRLQVRDSLSVNSHGHVWYNSVSPFVNLCSSLCWRGQMITITMQYTQIKAQRLLGQKSCETTGTNMVPTSVQHFYECLYILQKQQAYVKLALETHSINPIFSSKYNTQHWGEPT